MTIIINGTNNTGNINTGDANSDECLEACVAAMLAEGYNPYNIVGSLRRMAAKMDDATKEQ